MSNKQLRSTRMPDHHAEHPHAREDVLLTEAPPSRSPRSPSDRDSRSSDSRPASVPRPDECAAVC